MKNKTTTIVLALLLGGLGIHRFYLGQTAKGMFYLIFCWTLIPAAIAMLDVIYFAFMSDAKFNARHNPYLGRML